MKNSVTIYTGNIDVIRNNTGLMISNKAEKEIKKLLEAKKQIDEILETFKGAVGQVMTENNVDLIESGEIKISRKLTGRNFSFDPDKKTDDQFVQTISYPSVNTTKVKAYIELNGLLPEGIIENARKVKIDIEINE